MKIVILTEGGKGIGSGHLVRCLALYQAFTKMGIEPMFVVNKRRTNLGFLKLNRVKDIRAYSLNRLLKMLGPDDILVIDSYLISKDFYNKVSKRVRLLVSIDDLGRIRYPKGVVLNGSI
ncbi:UDP-2,4-diacetamido-2,4,6-trideoxy-beta-L-altropyranose hydrolase, partial [Candidatus Omnitrophota bacterium]